MKLNFEKSLRQSWPPENWLEHRVIVAVSGGADSVALLIGLYNLAKDEKQADFAASLRVAHFNHRWRGKESDEDEAFVAKLASDLSLEFVCQRADNQPADTASDSATNSGQGAESIARDQRYSFLREAANQNGARYIVTGHNQNDQVETVVHRIMRGTGVSGLRGIPSVRNLGDGVSIIRPMLSIDRNSIREYLTSIQQAFRVDSSNEDLKFTRNRIRNEILPALREFAGEQLDANILQLSSHACETQQIVDRHCEQLKSKAVTINSSSVVTIDCTALADQPRHLVCELLRAIWKEQHWPQRHMNSVRWQKLADMIGLKDSQEQHATMPGDIRATRTSGHLKMQQHGRNVSRDK